MIFDVYHPMRTAGGWIPGKVPAPTEWCDIVRLANGESVNEFIDKFRETKDGAFKKSLPAVCYMGSAKGTRAADNMTPTQCVMIDIDHCNNPQEAYNEVYEATDREWWCGNVLIAHVTPSGEGLRFVLWAQSEFGDNVAAQIKGIAEKMNLSKYGKIDEACKDFSRLSFLFKGDDLLWENAILYLNSAPQPMAILTNTPDSAASKQGAATHVPPFTEEEKAKYDAYEYKGTPVKAIIERWVEVKGAPCNGEIHNYYNDLIKNFRNITNNDQRALLYLLPRFGHTAEECESSIRSICRVNTLSKLPKEFYFFLKDNGYYKGAATNGEMAEYMMSEGSESESEEMPWLPPVFRELVNTAPVDFRPSVVNSLLPIMGTLTSYLKSEYYYDGREHTTSFFSVIYAPAGTGKGFVERFQDLLFENIKVRDYVQAARENIFQKALNRKGANDKAPEEPHTSLRIIPPKNSEAEFLQKQRDNKGYHMFTYAAEMDSWAKGVKAAGGNKDDMIRVAWDNQEYGQQFKAANTFKGKVRLFWNVLITGTLPQIMSYFKNVENGLVTRCSFTTIENQEFATAPIWKKLNSKSKSVIFKFIDRCDRMSYEEPCDILPEDVDATADDKFDDEIEWQFHFRPRKYVDMEWLRPAIEEFLEENRKRASLDFDKARDSFRRRAAVRGFRLGIMCHALWENPRVSDLQKCIPFIKWWMNHDLEASLKLWGNAYNNAVEDTPNLAQRSLYNQLGNEFTKNDVYVLCMKQGIKTPVRMIIHQWAKLGYVEKVTKNDYRKIKRV